MASIFKRKRRVKLPNGKTVIQQSAKWHIKFIDADGIERRAVGFKDKTASQQLAAKLEKEAELARAGIIDRYKEHRTRPLIQHLEDFRQSLLAKGCTTKHADQVTSRARRIVEGCQFKTWTDISASKVQGYLAGLRNRPDGISAQTFNFYLKDIKQFCRWMVQDRRASESPLEHLKGLNVRTDRRHDRRALEPDEVRRLLEATRAAGPRFGMDGYQRSLLYRLGIESGLRRNELKTLTVGSFDFENCTVTVEAAYSKNRKQSILPLRKESAVALQSYLAGKMPTVKVFNIPDKTAKMFKADLAAAGIDYVDEAGRYRDFHSLRHTTGSLLAASGVHPKVIQSIMRHGDINLTMSRYTHIFRGQESDAVAKLPDFSTSSNRQQVATGTDNKPVDVAQNNPEKLTPQLTPTAFSGCNQLAADVSLLSIRPEKADNHKPLQSETLCTESRGLSPRVIDKNKLRLRGFGPLTFGSVDRRSIQLSYRRIQLNRLHDHNITIGQT